MHPMYHFFSHINVGPHCDHAMIESYYDRGYVCTRLGKGILHQVRSVRVRLADFSPRSENRRILERSNGIFLDFYNLNQFSYHWKIGKLAKDFYAAKFGSNILSANKIRELFTDTDKSNMNAVLVYSHEKTPVGYCLSFETAHIIHYSYPFYQHPGFDPIEYKALMNINAPKVMGIAMMTKAVMWAKEQKKQYIYLGSVQDEKSLYKFQFKGVEWFDGRVWKQNKPAL